MRETEKTYQQEITNMTEVKRLPQTTQLQTAMSAVEHGVSRAYGKHPKHDAAERQSFNVGQVVWHLWDLPGQEPNEAIANVNEAMIYLERELTLLRKQLEA